MTALFAKFVFLCVFIVGQPLTEFVLLSHQLRLIRSCLHKNLSKTFEYEACFLWRDKHVNMLQANFAHISFGNFSLMANKIQR